MGRSRRPRNSWAASTCSSAGTSTRRSSSQRSSPPSSAAPSRSGPSGSSRPITRWPASPERPLADAHAVVDRLFREEAGRAVATLIRVLGDFDLAEEAVQEAFVVALESWPVHGVPDNPGAWITTTARNKAIDRLRRARRLVEKEPLLRQQIEAEEPGPNVDVDEMSPIPDDRLRLIFTCCHPALALDAQIGLTLRTLGGLTTPEIARAFLIPEPTL